MELLLLFVLVVLVVERIGEIAINRRNTRWLLTQGARWHKPDGFRLIVSTQLVLILGLLIESNVAPWTGIGPWTWPLLGLAALAQALRYWCISTLGPRWNIRVVTLPGSERIVGGPYRFFPHPNYVAVITESIVLPLAFGAWITALVVIPLTLLALLRRIRLEEHALRETHGMGGHVDA